MENLPNEILEIVVFNSLSEKKDTQKCYNINAKWRRNIENIFVAKILVVGGNSIKIEIIDLINTKLKSKIVVDEKASRRGAIGGILQDQLFICGGFGDSSRNISIIRQPQYCEKMMYPRRYMSSVVINETILWITGGMSKSGPLKSTEIVSLNQPAVSGPDLPFKVSHHSMVLVNPTTIYLIGGYQNNQLSKKTWIIDPTKDFQIKVGPSLNIGRRNHASSKMKIKEKTFLVVAGGWNNRNGTLDSIELLDTTCPDQGWKIGPQLPFKLSNSTLVSSPIGQNVVMIGGFINEQKGLQESPYLLELSGDSYETLDWKILDKKLKYPRHDHISFCISNDIATTLKTKSIRPSSGHAE